MLSYTRTRLLAALAIVVVIPIGLFARSQRDGADPSVLLGFLATYLGDTLWPFMFFFIGRFCFPNAFGRTLFFATLVITLSLEFGQLWNPPALYWLRQQPFIGFVLGNHFVWSDVICCWAGALFALLSDRFILAQAPRSGSAR